MLNNYFTLFKITMEINRSLAGQMLECVVSDSQHTLFLQFPEHSVLVHLGSGKNYFFMQNKFKKLPVPHFKRFKSLSEIRFISAIAFYQERVIEFGFENGFKLRLFLFQPQCNAVLFRDNDIEESYFQQKVNKFEPLYRSSFDYPALPYPGALLGMLQNQFTEDLSDAYPSLAKGPVLDELNSRINATASDPYNGLVSFLKELQSDHIALLFSEEELKKYQYCLPYIPTNLPDNVKVEIYDSPSRAIQTFVRQHFRVHEILSLKKSLEQTVRQELKYVRNSIQRLKIQLRKSQDKEKYRKLAQLIMWNLNQIPSGASEAEVIDYEDPKLKKVKIRLNPSVSPKDYADELFAKVKRLEDVSGIEERIRLLEQKYDMLQEYLEQLQNIYDLKELKLKSQKLSEFGIEPVTKVKKKKKQPERVPYREYYFNQYIIRVGKSARESDELTMKISKKFDWFFHAQDIKGSHVIVTHPEKNKLEHLPPEVIETAAVIAAYFSDARHSSYVPVQYTQVRYIRKPRKSPAGFVTFHQYQTVFVEPQKFDQLPIKTRKDLLP